MLKRIRKLLERRKDPDGAAAAPAEASEAPVQTSASLSAPPPPPIHEGPRVAHRPIAIEDLDPEAVKIVRRLTRFDHQAYLVGGCVRDLLLERRPKDFDVGTSATPRQIKRLFRNCRIIGRRFRLAHIYFQDGKIIEVATFRARDAFDDAEEAPRDDLLIRDDNVFGTPEEDALRRDFTINALFYDVADGTVLDHTDGLSDLRRRLVRTIGDPDIRFREDPIRVLRAIKFAARLDFEIEAGTLAALRRHRGDIRRAAPPRVLEEINRFCRGGAARRSFELLRETEVLDVVLPELAHGLDERTWKLLLALLDRVDQRVAQGAKEIRSGTIFAALLLPLLVARQGWMNQAASERSAGGLEDEIDALLGPVTQRLRAPRREQEHCRQLLLAIGAQLSGERKRPPRRGAHAREGREDLGWILEVVTAELGVEMAPHQADALEADEGAPGEEGPRRRRRGRRGGRRRRKADPSAEAAAPTEHAAAPAPDSPRPRGGSDKPARPRGSRGEGGRARGGAAERRDLPPPWSDDYFFAALPTAPEEGQEPAAAPPQPEELTGEETGPARGPKRRRRSRRRRRANGAAGEASPAGEAAPHDEDAAPDPRADDSSDDPDAAD